MGSKHNVRGIHKVKDHIQAGNWWGHLVNVPVLILQPNWHTSVVSNIFVVKQCQCSLITLKASDLTSLSDLPVTVLVQLCCCTCSGVYQLPIYFHTGGSVCVCFCFIFLWKPFFKASTWLLFYHYERRNQMVCREGTNADYVHPNCCNLLRPPATFSWQNDAVNVLTLL